MKTPAALAWLDLSHPRRMADLVELAKPTITVMVLVTAATGFLLGTETVEWRLLLLTLLGTGLVSAGGSALNHAVEHETDALMRRTANRPIPSGRLAVEPAVYYGSLLATSGVLVLLLWVDPLTALLGGLAVVLYVLVYTPLKRITSLATVVGAVPGAVPPLMGWTAARGGIDAGGVVLFAILFLWQLPHFLAIAWLCRVDYAEAGFPMISVVEPSGRSTARQMVLYCAALVPVSLLPSVLGLAGATYFLGALTLGLVFLGFCLVFPLRFTAASARNVLLASVAYLPALLGVLLLDRVAG